MSLWTNDGRISDRGFLKYNFIQRLYILWIACGKHIDVVIRDDAGGLSPEQFLEYDARKKKKDWGVDAAGKMVGDPGFVLGNSALSDSFSYLNHLCNSPAFHYINKIKRPPRNRMVEWKKQMIDFVRVIRFWEGNKKRMTSEFSISMPEFYVLISLYGEREVQGSTIYQDTFKRSFNSSPTKIKLSFGSLQAKGYIEKLGERRGSKMRITPLGSELVNKILVKYALS
jgi:hypothetical protein